MKTRRLTPLLALVLSAAACSDEATAPLAPEVAFAAAETGGGLGLHAIFLQGDYEPRTGESLVATVPGCAGIVNRSFNVDFGADDCLSITTTTGVRLADDAYFAFAMKAGLVKGAQFWIQDQSGPDGIAHESDKVTIDPQPASSGGFVLHVHRRMTVWRMGGHIKGKRGSPVGEVSVGDVVFYVP